MSKDKYVITQIINRKPVPMPTSELKEDGVFLNIHETMISQIVEAKNNREFEFVCSQIQNFIEENNIGVCFAINKSELTDCLQEHQRLKLEITDLEAKLAEKEKELHYKTAECEKWKADYENCSRLEKLMTKERQYCLDNWIASDQDKISFCIEQLEKVKQWVKKRFEEIGCIYEEDIKEEIDNQIEELKKG